MTTDTTAVVPPQAEVLRHPGWPELLRDFLRDRPACSGCGRAATTAHHATPVGVDPARELDPTNLVPVCLPCHFVLCHAGDWNRYVPGPALKAALRGNLGRVERSVRIGGTDK